MEFKLTPETHSPSNIPASELPLGNSVEITTIVENADMFTLPNKEALTTEQFESTVGALATQYTIALQYEKIRTETISEIDDLLKVDNKGGDWINNIKNIFEKAPQETARPLMMNLKYLPEGIQVELARIALEKAPQKAAPPLMWNLQYLPEGIREDIARIALEKAPQEAAPELIWNLQYLPEGIREDIARIALEKAPQKAAPELMRNLGYLPKEIQVELALLALKEAPQKAAPPLMWNLENLPEGIREDIARIALEKAPQEAAPPLMRNLQYLPEGIREDIARIALEKAPQETAPGLMRNLRYLPVEIREELARLALKEAPQEAAPGLMDNLKYLPEGIQVELKDEIMDIVRTTEKSRLTESENINPVLYKDIKGLKTQLSRQEFPKYGSRTVLLGGTLVNNAILRIIPNYAFVSWMKAYSAVEDWKKAGFDYVPIEPILKTSASENGRDVRVYTGVLGVSVENYLKMYTNTEFHKSVEKQVKTIRETLTSMGIEHGHLHYRNFCVLHERTPEGEIDWTKPPRVYCIDFDQAKSS